MATTINANANHNAAVVPSEVGWQFVPQYYTYMNKHPSRLHQFYTKNSSFIHSVDAQSSANGGIIIQVIGEMSNNGEAWRKFAQTFFLAEQPNGYFVLNDIFRYLKEEAVETDEIDAASTPAPVESQQPAPSPRAPPTPPVEQPVIEEPVTVQEPAPEPVVEQPKVNGIHPTEVAKSEPETTPAEPEVVEPAREPTPEPEAAPTPAEPEKAPTPEPEPEPVQPPAPVRAPSPPAPAPVQQPVQPTIPPAPKTWANLAAANSNKWGNAVAQEARGVSSAAVQSHSPVPSGTTTPNRDGHVTPNRTPRGDRDPHPAHQAAMSITHPQCFVKGVTEVVSHQALSSTLTTRFGPIKDVEIVRNKACAFLEFVNLDSAKRAIVASLPMGQGGEGGIRIDVGEAGQARINVETKKERADRPAPRPRGGAPNGDQRGGYRGRGGPGGGRGGRGAGPGAGPGKQ